MGTRQRILDTSLAMFNHHGSANITSLDIAAELEISPGNLYYHFKGKEEIINQLSKECELAVGTLLARVDLEAISESEYWVFLLSLLRVCLHYRFLFLDLQTVAPPQGNRGAQRLMKQLHSFTAHSLEALEEKALLQVKGEQREQLADNLFLLGLSWLCFDSGDSDDKAVERGAQRLISLVNPHLTRQLNLAGTDQ
ncbi:TetR/AcrR family transcriptional regulator [Ferrimonas sediminicola]|uniref:TetR/AcrR family transcriptional regulator n=1 Tax=Ferrimonas sediminicola TaxID=2569538 RepID=A0A4V6WMP9_9GAMM|nr:TetR/AcrR family transcriptional regulator [Ferrimonas sediminicola]TKB50363.1 TetR/AcrR family transcriptional regulator [Ferrimonas sediminicola]